MLCSYKGDESKGDTGRTRKNLLKEKTPKKQTKER